ncbi:sensor histidine kinase [Paractinoplanes durhamensis]|uniref:sensor histidine kinase n=1 Tax=Paractinoplanes durhamensis TaxID=113563 RepID=UPI00363E4CFC
MVLDELDKLARITQRVVTLMQVEEPHPLRPGDVDRAVERIARRWRPSADRQWYASSDVGLAVINAERLEAAIDCLIENALKFTGPGDRIALTGTREPAGWQIEIADSGTGMTAEQVAALSSGRPIGHTGTGLGMAIVRSVLKALGGELHIHSTVGAGTVVTLAVPAAGPGLDTAAAPADLTVADPAA